MTEIFRRVMRTVMGAPPTLGLVVSTATVVLSVALMVAGQETDTEEVVGGLAFVDEVKVTVVNIDVFVRDRKNNVVTGLTQDDFILKQDGQVRTLSHFAAYSQEVIAEIMKRREREATPVVALPVPDDGVDEAGWTARVSK